MSRAEWLAGWRAGVEAARSEVQGMSDNDVFAQDANILQIAADTVGSLSPPEETP